MKCGLFLLWSEWVIYLPHWLGLLMSAVWEPERGRDEGMERERGVWGWGNGGVGVWEGHSRPAGPGAIEPGSTSLHTDPALFSRGQTQRGHACAPRISTSRRFGKRNALSSVQTARNNTQTSSRHTWNRGDGWRLHRLYWDSRTLKGCQCSTTVLS